MTVDSDPVRALIVSFLGVLLVLGALASLAYLTGGSIQPRWPSRRKESPDHDSEPVRRTGSSVRHVVGFALLASGPLTFVATVFYVAVWVPAYWYLWLLGALVGGFGLLWLADVVGPPVALEKAAEERGERSVEDRAERPRTAFREAAGMLIGLGAAVAAAANVGGLLITGTPLFPPHPLNPLFPLALIVIFSAASRLIRGGK
jgi:hypothetical protein